MERKVAGILAGLSLAVCLAYPVVRFFGRIEPGAYKIGFLFASAAWFIFATLRVFRTKK
jgi:hypothetical protein